jgi:hypothetical protein
MSVKTFKILSLAMTLASVSTCFAGQPIRDPGTCQFVINGYKAAAYITDYAYFDGSPALSTIDHPADSECKISEGSATATLVCTSNIRSGVDIRAMTCTDSRYQKRDTKWVQVDADHYRCELANAMPANKTLSLPKTPLKADMSLAKSIGGTYKENTSICSIQAGYNLLSLFVMHATVGGGVSFDAKLNCFMPDEKTVICKSLETSSRGYFQVYGNICDGEKWTEVTNPYGGKGYTCS